MLWLYNFGIFFYGLIIRIFSLFNPKARFFLNGRKNIFEQIGNRINKNEKHIWFHFASLGEFEQGRSVLEKIKAEYPDKKIVLTFFSPSGYEIRKDYALAEAVFYLPLDTHSNAGKLIDAFNPELAVFTKYEYWHHYFKALDQAKVPLFIISGIFRPDQVYFKGYGQFYRNILKRVTHFFVQNEESKKLLAAIGINQVSIAGDTRFDRVVANAAAPKSIPVIAAFSKNHRICVAGSSWLADERLLATLPEAHQDWKFIIVPHETDEKRIAEVSALFPGAARFSSFTESQQNAQVLIIDSVGMLSALYQYADIAYIGGGFGVGIHNTLEAAAFGIPVIFGPNYQKFQEAKDLLNRKAALSISTATELKTAFDRLTEDPKSGQSAGTYVTESKGATDLIYSAIRRYLS
ncbi:3-deoxy-D-manno-octulosonic acid transferase [Pedobacter duraquae]|uniref:3-deoxy-D-manno-octulosonic acid transferase n=1 Tax=Pedobacter duraquae TaxID=425511 RepID=A0A4V3C2U6_9SPHI|nr:glycosyltransferase N-terminal domain-containing protein [Pedobacter duraquae]TDO19739.1 3-deoxy-D-manno-octulosonic-acid transferase [Pedobacter duraquae]